MLAPLTKLTSIKRNFKWTKFEQYAFGKIKREVACDTLLTYTDFNVHTYAIALQLVAVIIHKGKHIYFYSIKLTDVQQWYAVTEIEITIIVETLKDFKTILLSKKLRIYTDHKNLTCNNFNTYRVLIW